MAMLTQAEETSLITRYKDGGCTFAELYNCYFSRVYNYVHYRVDDFHAADDLISQIFEKLFSRLKHYNSEKAAFSVWLFTIARNTITDYYRSKKRTNFNSLEVAAELIDYRPGPDDIAAVNEVRKYLRKALKCLNQRERDMIALKFWSGFSNRDIAKLVGISESNAGVIIFRAMRRLRMTLESQGLNMYV